MAALLVAAAPASAATDAVVKGVKDGDTVKLRVGSKSKTVNLKGVDAPSGDDCYAAEAKKKLSNLLKKGDDVKLSGGKSAVIKEGKTVINAKMVASGAAEAGKASGKLGKQLEKAEQKAIDKGRGMWGACGGDDGGQPGDGTQPGEGTPGTQPGDVTGQPAIDQMTAAISGNAFRTFQTQGQTSDRFEFHFCQDKRFRYKNHTSNADPQFSFASTSNQYADSWTVTEALIRDSQGYRGAFVEGTFTTRRVDDGGGIETVSISEPYKVAVEQLNGQWHVGGRVAEFFQGQADCDSF